VLKILPKQGTVLSSSILSLSLSLKLLSLMTDLPT
jgi:hypothetical protein